MLRYAAQGGSGADPNATSITRVVTEKIHSKVRRCVTSLPCVSPYIEETNPVGNVRCRPTHPSTHHHHHHHRQHRQMTTREHAPLAVLTVKRAVADILQRAPAGGALGVGCQ